LDPNVRSGSNIYSSFWSPFSLKYLWNSLLDEEEVLSRQIGITAEKGHTGIIAEKGLNFSYDRSIALKVLQ